MAILLCANLLFLFQEKGLYQKKKGEFMVKLFFVFASSPSSCMDRSLLHS
jgi:hypothetical protein